jgi:hypothetical protein
MNHQEEAGCGSWHCPVPNVSLPSSRPQNRTVGIRPLRRRPFLPKSDGFSPHIRSGDQMGNVCLLLVSSAGQTLQLDGFSDRYRRFTRNRRYME